MKKNILLFYLFIFFSTCFLSCELPGSSDFEDIKVTPDLLTALPFTKINVEESTFFEVSRFTSPLNVINVDSSIPGTVRSPINRTISISDVETTIDLFGGLPLIASETQIDLNELVLKSGTLDITFSYTEFSNISVTFSSNQIINTANSTKLSRTINLEKGNFPEISPKRISIDLAGYTIKPVNNLVKTLISNGNVNIVTGDNLGAFSIKQGFELKNLSYSVAKCYFSNRTINFASKTIDLSDILGGSGDNTGDNKKSFEIGDEGHELYLDIENPIGTPIKLDLSNVTIKNNDNSTQTLNYTGPEGTLFISEARLMVNNSVYSATPTKKTIKLDRTNSNIESIITNNTKEIVFNVSIEINPVNYVPRPTSHFILPLIEVDSAIRIQLPVTVKF